MIPNDGQCHLKSHLQGRMRTMRYQGLEMDYPSFGQIRELPGIHNISITNEYFDANAVCINV